MVREVLLVSVSDSSAPPAFAKLSQPSGLSLNLKSAPPVMNSQLALVDDYKSSLVPP